MSRESIEYRIEQLELSGGGLRDGTVIFVSSKDDLPTASGGVITLLDNVTYFFTTEVDLLGDYLEVHAANTSAITNITVENLNFVITEIR